MKRQKQKSFQPILTAKPDPGSAPYSRLVNVDAAMAKKLMQANYGNRPLSQDRVERFAKQMKAGEWNLVPDAIAFAPNGRMINGQHRLGAVIASEVACLFFISYNIPEESFDVIDIGKVKSGSDTLACMGEERYRNELAAALRIIGRWELGNPGMFRDFSNRELVCIYERHPTMTEFTTKWCGRQKVRRMMSTSQIAAADYLFSMKDPVLAGAFLEEVVTGERIGGTDPSYLLRARLMEMPFKGGRMGARHILALAIKAWNMVRSGKRSRLLFFKEGEEFPAIE